MKNNEAIPDDGHGLISSSHWQLASRCLETSIIIIIKWIIIWKILPDRGRVENFNSNASLTIQSGF